MERSTYVTVPTVALWAHPGEEVRWMQVAWLWRLSLLRDPMIQPPRASAPPVSMRLHTQWEVVGSHVWTPITWPHSVEYYPTRTFPLSPVSSPPSQVSWAKLTSLMGPKQDTLTPSSPPPSTHFHPLPFSASRTSCLTCMTYSLLSSWWLLTVKTSG